MIEDFNSNSYREMIKLRMKLRERQAQIDKEPGDLDGIIYGNGRNVRTGIDKYCIQKDDNDFPIIFIKFTSGAIYRYDIDTYESLDIARIEFFAKAGLYLQSYLNALACYES